MNKFKSILYKTLSIIVGIFAFLILIFLILGTLGMISDSTFDASTIGFLIFSLVVDIGLGFVSFILWATSIRKCNRCGRAGITIPLNSSGICPECEKAEAIESEIKELEEKSRLLKKQVKDEEELFDITKQKAIKELEEKLELLKSQIGDAQELYDTTKQKAIDDASAEIDKTLSEKQELLYKLTEEIAEFEEQHRTAEEKAEKAQKAFERKANKGKSLTNELEAIKHTIDTYFEASYNDIKLRIPQLTDDEIREALNPSVELKLHCMDIKQLKKEYNSIQKQIREVLEKYESRYTTKANIAIYKLMVLALEAELQNILFALNFGNLDNALNNIKVMTKKYIYIASDGNQNIAPTIVKFVGELEYLFCEAIKVEYEYYAQKERIKEEQRALREQMKQEAEERKILEQQKKQVEKEESKYKNEMDTLQEQLNNTADNEKIVELNKRLEELQKQLEAVSEKKDEIISRQHGKAGYVYVISNKGSFGDDVFKIGMTRRLDPQDRINELGNASVPFPFDVHSFIFSDDAVGLEHNIHVTLNNERVNKVNLRKEFFRVSIDQLEELVYNLQPTAEFNRTMMAEQYNQSISLSQPLNSFVDGDLEEDEEEYEEDIA